MMKYTFKNYTLSSCLLLLSLLFSCKGNESFEPVKFIGTDKIARIELSPNAPKLIADGQAELHFKLRCLYQYGEGKELKEYPFVDGRISYDDIKITASTGEVFGVNEVYKTKQSDDSVFFTASIDGLTSDKVAVALDHSPAPSYEALEVPLRFHILYSEQSKDGAKDINQAMIQEILDHTNKVFSGSLMKAPSSIDAKIKFVIESINKVSLKKDEEDKIVQTIQDKGLMEDEDKVVNIWLMESIPDSYWDGRITEKNIIPAYILQEQNQALGQSGKKNTTLLPGISLTVLSKEAVENAKKEKDLEPSDVGFAMTFNDINQAQEGLGFRNFSTMLGFFYGLRPTGSSNENLIKAGRDLDYCSDTFSYIKARDIRQKKTFPNSLKQSFIYDSYNIMDTKSSFQSISKEQVIRIRKTMEYCLFRSQGKKK